MKLCFYTGFREMLRDTSREAIAEYMRENGFCYYEHLEDVLNKSYVLNSIDEAKELRSFFDKNGISSNCYSVVVNLYADHGTECIKMLKKQADIAKTLGCKYLHHTICTPLVLKDDAPDYDTVTKTVLPALTEVIRYASSIGITVIYEPQGMYFNGIDGFGKLFRRLLSTDGCENIGVCFDTGNSMFADCNPYEFLKEFLPYVKNVHLKDYRIITEEDKDAIVEAKRAEYAINAKPEKVNDGCAPSINIRDLGIYVTRSGALIEERCVGEGDARVADCIRLLIDHGYDGVFSIESIPASQGLDHFGGNARVLNFLKDLL